MLRLGFLIVYFSFLSVYCIGQTELPFHIWDIYTDKNNTEQLLAIADSFYNKKDYDKALRFYEQVKKESQKTGNNKRIVHAYTSMANAYKQQGKYTQLDSILTEAIAYCKEADSISPHLSTIYNLWAVAYADRGMYKAAANSYELALHASISNPDSHSTVAYIYNNMATLYGVMDFPDKAFSYLKKVDSMLERNPDSTISVRNNWSYAYLYAKKKDYEKSKQYLFAIFPLTKSIGNKEATEFMIFWKLADIAIRQNNIDTATFYLGKMTRIKEVEPMMQNRVHVISATIFAYKKEYEPAIKEMKKNLNIVEQSQLLPDIVIAHSGLAKLYAATKNYKDAYFHEQQARILNDSLNKTQQAKNIAIIEAQYQSAQTQKELAEKEFLIHQQQSKITIRNIAVGVTLLVTLLLLTLFIIVRINHRNKQSMKDEKMQLLLKEKGLNEMKALMDGEEQERTRIARDIHDGLMIQFSTIKMNLSAILNQHEDTKPYLKQLDKAIASLRSTAHNLMPDVLLEGGLAEAIYYFCENIKQNVTFEITFNLLNDIPRFEEKFELAVYRIVQELIQNIVKHAEANDAYIQIGYRHGLLNITIEDDGIGIEEKPNHKGLGLKSIRNRINTLNGSMEISSNKNTGTSIILEFLVIPVIC